MKCMGGHFFPCHPYMDSTTVLSDVCMLYTTYTPVLHNSYYKKCNDKSSRNSFVASIMCRNEIQ